MRDDAMKDRDDLDILLDAALATYANPGMPPGLASRILVSARRIDGRRSSVRWLPWAAPVLAALLLAVIFSVHHADTHRMVSNPTAQLSLRPAPRTPATPNPAVETQQTAARSNPPRTVSAMLPTAQQPPLPRQEVFPTPTPLSPEEQALVALVNRDPEKVARRVAQPGDANQPQPIEPLRIAAIHIPPLTPPDNGDN